MAMSRMGLAFGDCRKACHWLGRIRPGRRTVRRHPPERDGCLRDFGLGHRRDLDVVLRR